ncbi:polysaccharide biosynthesis/export family protein [Sphingobacterium suaedae]|uniref:Polysaccharide biosynthesis/export family protein n=1 Tax=Sphingobacterium suaedae TaxID=1686402 RepID=A0ABW5KQC0_9SPHI
MNKFILGMWLTAVALLSSCGASKVVYVKDLDVNSPYETAEAPALRVQKNDRLSIVISAKNPELAAPFNGGYGAYKVNDDGSVASGLISSPGTQGYLVDKNGKIDFPVLGSLNVLGLTLDQVRTLIRERLISESYISDPVIKVELLNLKISMMGEVAAISVINVPDAQITLLEAIAKAGGLSRNADPSKIVVLREEAGVRKKIMTDIESKEIFNSPAYYLQQNDIVYVEPKSAVTTPKEERTWRVLGLTMGMVTFVLSLATLLK